MPCPKCGSDDLRDATEVERDALVARLRAADEDAARAIGEDGQTTVCGNCGAMQTALTTTFRPDARS